MVQRERGEGRVEGPGLVELLDRRLPEDRALRCLRVDGDDVVAVGSERERELAAAAADLEHPRGRRRQLTDGRASADPWRD